MLGYHVPVVPVSFNPISLSNSGLCGYSLPAAGVGVGVVIETLNLPGLFPIGPLGEDTWTL